jgi:hypothetical protein
MLPKYWYADGLCGQYKHWDPKQKKFRWYGWRCLTERRILKASDAQWVKDLAKQQHKRATYWNRKWKASLARKKKQAMIDKKHRKK